MSIGDVGAGRFTAVAVMPLWCIASRRANRQDRHRHVDGQLARLENAIMRYTVEGEVPVPLGARHPTISRSSLRHLDGPSSLPRAMTAVHQTCEALARPDMATDPGYKTTRWAEASWQARA